MQLIIGYIVINFIMDSKKALVSSASHRLSPNRILWTNYYQISLKSSKKKKSIPFRDQVIFDFLFLFLKALKIGRSHIHVGGQRKLHHLEFP